MTPEEREQKIREITERLAERLRQQWPDESVPLSEIEDVVGRVGGDTLRELTEEMLREQVQRREGNQCACPCGKRAVFRGYYGLTVTTEYGKVRLRRAYFYCAACQHGHCPVDRELGLGPAQTTPSVQAKVTVLAAQLAYTQVPMVLNQLGLPYAVCVKTVETIAQQVGAQVQAAPPAPLFARATGELAIAMDGTMVPTHTGSRETRCAVIYEPDFTTGRTTDACAALRKEYLATTDSRESLAVAACARVKARRPRGALVAALGDGADWIWALYAKYLPRRIEILDFYHVLERVGEIATARFPDDPAAAQTWLKTQKRALLNWGPRQLLNELRCWEPATAAGREVRRQQLGYFEKQQERMWYPTYLKLGLPIGSGAVEGACKHVVGDRFKGTGMRWKLPTAEPLLQVRAALLTNPTLDLRPYILRAATSASTPTAQVA